jgi:hypothetical protein
MEKKPEAESKPKTNIVSFPMERRVPDGILVPPEFKARQAKDYLTGLCGEIANATVCSAAANGVDCDADSFHDDMIVIELMLEAALYRTEGLEHPMNEVMEGLVYEIVTKPREGIEDDTEDNVDGEQ